MLTTISNISRLLVVFQSVSEGTAVLPVGSHHNQQREDLLKLEKAYPLDKCKHSHYKLNIHNCKHESWDFQV